MIPDDIYPVLYKVVPGDTLNELASRYNTTINNILHANPNIQPNNLQIGEIVTIFPNSI